MMAIEGALVVSSSNVDVESGTTAN